MTGIRIELSRRERAILRAVAAGRGVLVSSCEPALTIDGCWCDHAAVHNLVEAGLIEKERQVPYGLATPAVITRAGEAALAEDPRST
ncbi:hypothetical protein [Amycolatopsis regifaucium]|uniref:Uncharacterized protein n=1 Tax=Amycolatopsis regifaucium TaxID=546365 RepID=A0A154MWV3_9PSEU|nr:hypothetical protein [Amycolatopsis regifaucium]KZB88413.1 hypothetical protein AVL48_18755 [Amycolatopsis regifaucium]OKA04540.1 hypothetical protein ATP06_0231755 [Amycolatopsis regifaucium]